MSRALLFSLLARQQLVLKETFRSRYPHPWLVWEAGVWNVPEFSEQNSAATQLPSDSLHDCLPTGDVLCFELTPEEGREGLRLGRSDRNALVVNDATVSREHALLVLEDRGGWHLEVLPEATDVRVNGSVLAPGERTPLGDRSDLRLGDVRMTFHAPDSFHERVTTHSAQLAHEPGGQSPGV
ncbi:MAG: FHA domain-containing protein [Myxococcaceae bacterium]|nr:FHA domain-containing protein [Myxococcaceae bacterium]MCI0671909.1 FHA domain-containing protein [Myxococcaceae bacterium]